MERKKSKQKATKAIRIKEDEKVTRVEPAKRNMNVEVSKKSSGGVSLTMEMAIDD